MTRRKIVFIIVEGPSDESALGVLMGRLYDKAVVHVEIMHCDITTEYGVNPTNIVAKLGNTIKKYAGQIYKPSDFVRIIHITDMDGAFIPDHAIIEDVTAEKTSYDVTSIRTQNKSAIADRNRRKRENLSRLSSINRIWKIPYRIYYMSCNLDHALYNKLNSSNREKEDDARAFAKKYMDNIPDFVRFIREAAFCDIQNYDESWDYIREACHSLERHTNFGLCLENRNNEAESNVT